MAKKKKPKGKRKQSPKQRAASLRNLRKARGAKHVRKTKAPQKRKGRRGKDLGGTRVSYTSKSGRPASKQVTAMVMDWWYNGEWGS